MGLAEAIGDQEMHGATEVTEVKTQTGNRALFETGGMPWPESNVPYSENVDATSNIRIPGVVQKERPVSSNPDWGLDIQIIDDTLATDPFLLVGPDTTLYLVYKYMGPLISWNSSVTICESTDGGDTWNWVLDANVDDTTEIYNLDATMDGEGDSVFIFVICNAQDDDIWLLRYNITAGTTDWVQITTGFVFDPAIDDMDNPASDYAYMTYCVYDSILRFRASSDYGATWSSPYGVHDGATVHNPDIRMNVGTNIWAYILWDNGPVIYSKGNDWQGFAGWAGISEHIHNFNGGSDDVNGQITGGYQSDEMWVGGEENLNNSGDWNIVWDYTVDGLAWRNDTMWPNIELAGDPALDEKYFQILVGWDNSGQARAVYNAQTSPADTRVDYQFFMAGSWSATTDLSDYLSKAGTKPTVNYNPVGGGGAIAYCGYNAIWYDDYWNTAIQEIPVTEPYSKYVQLVPNISRDYARLSFTIQTSGMVDVSIFDAAGRMVDNLVHETLNAGEHTVNIEARNLASGIYFVKVDTPDGVGTKTMTIIR
jgi:hypothetical protein